MININIENLIININTNASLVDYMKQKLTLFQILTVEQYHTFEQSIDDTLSFNEQFVIDHELTGNLVFMQNFNDTITLNQTLTHGQHLGKTFSDTLDFIQDVDTIKVISQSLNDTLILSQALGDISTEVFDDSLTFNQTLTHDNILERTFSNTVIFTQGITSTLIINQSLNDTLSLRQTLGNINTENINNTITFTDTLTRHNVLKRTLSNTITFTSIVTHTDILKRTLNDTLALTQTVVANIVSGETVILINSAWLTANAATYGGPPYVLTQPSTIYRLTLNVTTVGAAFMILGNNITLDLNGFTVTYGNSTPLTVVNGGFETGSIGATSISGWDLTGASAAAIAANTNYLFGNQVLRFTNFSGTQIIKTASANYLTIPSNGLNRSWTATVTPANPNTDNSTAIQILVIDTVTNTTLASAYAVNVQRGFTAIASFVPTTTHPLKLEIIATSSNPTNIDIDAVELTVSYDYGIIASGAYPGDAPASGIGFSNLPSAIQSYYGSNRTSMLDDSNFILQNGSITQGTGNGTYSSPLFFEFINAFTINEITSISNGQNINNLDGYKAGFNGGNILIENSTFQDNAYNIFDRQNDTSTIALSPLSSVVTINNNRVLGSPQNGIFVAGNPTTSTLSITNNTITMNACVADSVGAGGVSLNNFSITGNTIVPTKGGGIAIDGYTSTGSNNGVIQNNYVSTQDAPNRETGVSSIGRALRMRNDVDAEGPHTNIDISGNTFISTNGPGYVTELYTCWFTYVNNSGAMNNANVNFHNNTVEAIVNTMTSGYRAYALAIDGMDPGINLTMYDNTLESNDTSLLLGGYNDQQINGMLFLSNTFDKSSVASALTYTGISVGFDVTTVSNTNIIGTQLENGAAQSIYWNTGGGAGSKNINIGWILTVNVTNSSGGAVVSGATVTVTDSASHTYNTTTNASGVATLNIPITNYSGTTSEVIVNYAPFTLAVSKSGFITQSGISVTITGNTTKNVSLVP